jgi:hypothetical protein
MGFWASDRCTPAAKSLYRSIFLDYDIFELPFLSLIFLLLAVLCSTSEKSHLSEVSEKKSRFLMWFGKY